MGMLRSRTADLPPAGLVLVAVEQNRVHAELFCLRRCRLRCRRGGMPQKYQNVENEKKQWHDISSAGM